METQQTGMGKAFVIVRVMSESQSAMKGMRGRLGRRRGERGSAAAERNVKGGKIGRDGPSSRGGDDGGFSLLQKPLDGLAVGFVAQFPGQLKDPSGTGGRHSNATPTAVNLGVAVLGGSLDWRVRGGGSAGGRDRQLLLLLLLVLLGGIEEGRGTGGGMGIGSGGDGEGGVDEVGRSSRGRGGRRGRG